MRRVGGRLGPLDRPDPLDLQDPLDLLDIGTPDFVIVSLSVSLTALALQPAARRGVTVSPPLA